MRRRAADLVERLLRHSSARRVERIADVLERDMPRPGDAWHPRLVAERLAQEIVKGEK